MRWGLWISAVLVGACVVAPGRGELAATVVVEPVSAPSWEDDSGTRVTLERASIALGNLYLHEPGDTRAARLSPLELLVPTAYAHPGHDDAGDVAGELLGTWPVDLVGGVAELGEAVLYEGSLESATLVLADAPVALEGTVTAPTGEVRPFAFEVWPTQTLTGLPFDASFTVDDDPTIRIEIDAAWMLSYVDWQTEDTDGDGVLTELDGELESLVLFGVHSTGAYAVRVAGA